MNSWTHFLSSLSWYGPGLNLLEFIELSTEPNMQKLREVLKTKSKRPQNLTRAKKLFEQDWRWVEKSSAHWLTPLDSTYPERLLGLERPPLALIVDGSVKVLKDRSISVVGSRKPNEASRRWMDEEFAQFIKHNDVVTVSGGARGLDQKAHGISLRCGRPTLVFIPSGLKEIYPQSLVACRDEIIACGGAIVSGFSPYSRMQKGFFHCRNRWIAAMGDFSFVVQAGRRSGTLLTAHAAVDLGKTVACLPHAPGTGDVLGGIDLLAHSCVLVRDALDLELLSARSFSQELKAEKTEANIRGPK